MPSLYRLKDLGVALAPGTRVIKAAEFNDVDVAEQIIKSAQEQAEQIVQKAERIYEDQKQQGYRDGVKQAQTEAAERLLNEHALLDRHLCNLENEVVTVTTTLLRRLLEEYDDSERLRLMARSMLKTLRGEKRIRLHVAPDMYSQVQAMAETLSQSSKQLEFLEVLEDPELEGTNLTMEGAIGRVDGNLEVQLDEIEVMLRRCIAAHMSEPEGEAVP